MRKLYLFFVFVFVCSFTKTYGQAPTPTTPASAPNTPACDTCYKPILPLYRDVLGDSTVIGKKNKKQEKDFEHGLYAFPPKPRNKWEVGINLGGLFISGQVATRGGYAGGLYVRKALGYVLSIKAQVLAGTTYGLNWKSNDALSNNPVLNGDDGAATDYAHQVITNPTTGKPQTVSEFFYNYKANIKEASAEAVFTLNNIGYHKTGKDRKFDIYGGVGGGGMIYATWYNALNAQGQMYNFYSIYNGNDYSNRKKTIAALEKLFDKTYETPAEGQPDKPSLFNEVFNPVFNVSLGFGYHISKRFTLTLMEKASLVQSNLLDGDRWSEHPYNDPALVPHWDTYHFVSLSLGYFIGGHKRVEPLYWQNPSDYTYDALQTLVKKNVDDLVDSDNDGVIDKLDREPHSPPGAIVDTHGVTMDSDHDGVPDYKDKSPFDPPEAVGHVDSLGVPLDSDKDGVPDYKDKEPNTPPGSLVDANGRAITPSSIGAVAAGGNWFLPAIFFDLDKDVVKPDMYIQMKYVATVLSLHPELKIVAYGNTDIRASDKYNEDLSMRRANHAKDYLVKVYGIDPARIITKWDGKKDPLIKGLPNRYDPKYEGQQYYNRRVEFRIYDEKTDK